MMEFRGARARAGTFPEPQRTPCRGASLSDDGATAVVLVGDAAHAFPPDIGQGVNAALASVMHLARALDEAEATQESSVASSSTSSAGATSTPPRRLLAKALPAFGKACAPEAEAVARIAQIGFPYQYPLTREKNPLARPMWFANFLLRTFVLSRVAPGLFAPAAIVLVQRSHLTYREVWQQAQRTTRLLQAGAAVALSTVLWQVMLRRICVPL